MSIFKEFKDENWPNAIFLSSAGDFFLKTTLQIGMELVFPTWILKEFYGHRMNSDTQSVKYSFCLEGSLLQLPFQSEFCSQGDNNSDHILDEFGAQLLFLAEKWHCLLIVVPWHFWSEKKYEHQILTDLLPENDLWSAIGIE